MKQTLRLLCVLAAATMATGCVIHVGADDDDRSYIHDDGIKAKEARNRDIISGLALGISAEAVRDRLGEPDFSEAWMEDGHEVRVLRYRTHRTHSDGDTTRDETTPLVFRDGKLEGIGERAEQGARGQ
ncbi:MAG: DUF3192 domain-containing protein [Nevskiales bacterium]|nr:DUF3192 domain-containing protein [Nevskiales bacterium]